MISVRKFSKRVLEIDISGIRKIFEAAGSDAINLGLGQPDFDTPEHIKKAAIKAIEEGFTSYTKSPGIPELREALAQKFKRENDFEVSPNEIIVTSAASEGLNIALSALVEEGDEVLVPDPGFVSYAALAKIAGGKAVPVPLSKELRLSPEGVKERISRKTKALIINSPSNPTGTVQTRAEIKALAEIATDYKITIISDEVYEHFIYEGEHVSPACYSDNVITVNAVSKTYAMTGWRLGYVAAKREYVEQLIKVHQYVQACANSISQKAALAAIAGPQNCVIAMRDEFRRRRDYLLKRLSEIGLRCVKPHGAFYAFPEVGDDRAVSKKLIENNVITVPGSEFGKNGKGFLRITYSTSMQNLEKATGIMERVL